MSVICLHLLRRFVVYLWILYGKWNNNNFIQYIRKKSNVKGIWHEYKYEKLYIHCSIENVVTISQYLRNLQYEKGEGTSTIAHRAGWPTKSE